MITGAQIRQACFLLGWSDAMLADRSQRRLKTVARAKNLVGEAPANLILTLISIQGALEAAGIEFVSGADGVGAKLKPGASPSSTR